jgi:transposase-like protein
VDKHLKDGITVPQLCEQYGLHETQVKDWCRWQRQYGLPKQLTGKKRSRPRTVIGEETLEQKVKRLEMENALLKKFNELLMEEETKRK